MMDSREQRAVVQSCFLLGKNAAETVVMLKTAYRDDALGEPKYTSGLVVSKDGKCRSTIFLALAVNQQHEPTEM